MRPPHFVIIGAMKSATSTLHDQLALQPGIFMSRPKEPNFFSDDAEYARGLDWYASLFRDAPRDALCGESSTHYTKLPTYPATVDRLARHAPDVRLIYVMRHPVERLRSHYAHEWTENRIRADIDRAVRERSELVDYGRYAMQLAPYLERFGPSRILPVFFERLTRHPQEELERVCRFIGYDGAPTWQRDLPPSNATRQRLRKSAWRDMLVELPGVRALSRRLVPGEVRERVKDLWRLQGRPEPSAETVRHLHDLFDSDLALLGDWLGVALDCERYRGVVTDTPLEWAIRELDEVG